MTTKVTVFDDSSGTVCLGRCGSLAAVAEAFEFVRRHLELRYGPAVVLEWRDLAVAENQQRDAGLIAQIRAGQLPLPLVTIDGVVRLCGNVEYRAIVEAIETGKEVGPWRTGTMS